MSESTAGPPPGSAPMSSGMNPSPPIVVADDQGITDVVEQPALHVNPFEAAITIRNKVKSISFLLQTYLPPQTQVFDPMAILEIAKTGLLRHREGMDTIVLVETDNSSIRLIMDELAGAIERRRVTEGRELINKLRLRVNRQDESISKLRMRFGMARDHYRSIKGRLEVLPLQSAPTDETRKEMHDLCDQIRVLTQSLPTFPNAPLAPADNQLRAIATLLKNGGYLESSSEFVKVASIEDPDEDLEDE